MEVRLLSRCEQGRVAREFLLTHTVQDSGSEGIEQVLLKYKNGGNAK